MSTFKVLGTNHTSFTVSNLDRSVAFFQDVLGYEVTSKAPRDPAAIERITGVQGADIVVAYVRRPDQTLELIEYIGPPERGRVRSRPCDTGFAHVAYDVDDIDAAIEAAAGHGVVLRGEVYTVDQGPNSGNRVAYLKDPDDITIEFIEKR